MYWDVKVAKPLSDYKIYVEIEDGRKGISKLYRVSESGRLVILAHTDRDGRIRIISARKATKRETKFYEDSN